MNGLRREFADSINKRKCFSHKWKLASETQIEIPHNIQHGSCGGKVGLNEKVKFLGRRYSFLL